MSFIIPRPARDIVLAYLQSSARPNFANEAVKVALRTTVAVAGFFVVASLPAMTAAEIGRGLFLLACNVVVINSNFFSAYLAIGVFSAVSLPSLAIALGSYLLASGITGVVSALALGSFKALAITLASASAGYVILECHDILKLGALEMFVLNE
jgi:hypothetical protein